MIEKVVHVKKDKYDAYVGRKMPGLPTTYTKFGNPFKLDKKKQNHDEVMFAYFNYLIDNPELIEEAKKELGSFTTLSCWCSPEGGLSLDDEVICHAQFLGKAINGVFDGMKEFLDEWENEDKK